MLLNIAPLSTRRTFLGSSIAGTLGFALSPAMQRLLAADGPQSRAKSCILIWLNGGPSHIDTFDPKPGADTNGPFTAIDTQVPGTQFSQHLPKLAAQANHLAVIRSMTSPEGDHERAVDPHRLAGQPALTARALRFRKSPNLKAFDLSEEKPETMTAYGATQPEGSPVPGTFGKACLMARRLIETGVRFVEVTLDGWDTHANNFAAVEALLNQLDPALASLTSDLSDRGMLGETLIVCMGEFGRTPQINPQMGRDHWSEAFSVVLAGGGVRGGQTFGSSDAKGEKVAERPVTVPDLYATLLAAFGIDGNKPLRTPSGRPIKLSEKGSVVGELLT
jgi:uncharacterized protein (DUF1501 family)